MKVEAEGEKFKKAVAWRAKLADVKEFEKSLLKIDPTDPGRATVMDLAWIERVMDELGICSQRDLQTCDAWRC